MPDFPEHKNKGMAELDEPDTSTLKTYIKKQFKHFQVNGIFWEQTWKWYLFHLAMVYGAMHSIY